MARSGLRRSNAAQRCPPPPPNCGSAPREFVLGKTTSPERIGQLYCCPVAPGSTLRAAIVRGKQLLPAVLSAIATDGSLTRSSVRHPRLCMRGRASSASKIHSTTPSVNPSATRAPSARTRTRSAVGRAQGATSGEPTRRRRRAALKATSVWRIMSTMAAAIRSPPPPPPPPHTHTHTPAPPPPPPHPPTHNPPHTHTHSLSHARMHTHTHTHTYARTHCLSNARTHARTHTHTHTHAHTYTRTHIRTHTHTHAPSPRSIASRSHSHSRSCSHSHRFRSAAMRGSVSVVVWTQKTTRGTRRSTT